MQSERFLPTGEKHLMKSLEYVENQIVKLKDDLQHYTMVEKDSALASQIRYDLEQFETIEKELKEKEELIQALNIITCENGDLLKYKKALENISKAYGNYANHKISEYELIMIVSENITH